MVDVSQHTDGLYCLACEAGYMPITSSGYVTTCTAFPTCATPGNVLNYCNDCIFKYNIYTGMI